MIMCVLLCYPVSIRIYYQQGGLFLVLIEVVIIGKNKTTKEKKIYIYDYRCLYWRLKKAEL